MTVRPARPEEAPALAALAAEAHVEGWDAAALERAAAEPAWGLWVAPGAAGPRGFALAQFVADEAELLLIAVEHAVRRGGLGAALFKVVLGRAEAEGAAAIFLEVAEGNAGARAFYEGLGFAEVGRRRRYYRDGQDAVVMRRAVRQQTVATLAGEP